MNPIHQALLRHNRNTPRYTSYPTVPQFHTDIGSSRQREWLKALGDGDTLSLYLHIPYCKTLCWYCGCNTKATSKYAPVRDYVGYLLREIDLVAAQMKMPQTVMHIHFGGGSPSMLAAEDFARLMSKLKDRFQIADTAEIAIEVDPRELTETKVATYRRFGVNRVSFGIQDFHADVQRAINRRQPFHVVYDAVKLVKDYGIERINLDLLYGLPHQSKEKIQANVNFANALAPSRIALFGYAHVPWMKKHMRLIDESVLPGASERLQLFDVAADRLKSLGYHSIGLDHFVRADDPMLDAVRRGKLRRNFQGYTTDDSSGLIGFGVSAISSLPDGYSQNASDTRTYYRALDTGELPVTKGKEITIDDKVRRRIIEQLMCYGAVDLEKCCTQTGSNASNFSDATRALSALQNDGLVHLDGSKISVPASARQAVRLVCAAFDAYLAPASNRHAQVA